MQWLLLRRGPVQARAARLARDPPSRPRPLGHFQLRRGGGGRRRPAQGRVAQGRLSPGDLPSLSSSDNFRQWQPFSPFPPVFSGLGLHPAQVRVGPSHRGERWEDGGRGREEAGIGDDQPGGNVGGWVRDNGVSTASATSTSSTSCLPFPGC